MTFSRTSVDVSGPAGGATTEPFPKAALAEHAHRRHLLTIEELFEIRGRGLLVTPLLNQAEARHHEFDVLLVHPDGRRVSAKAFAQIPFITPTPPVLQAHLGLKGVAKHEVPLGTEVWTFEGA